MNSYFDDYSQGGQVATTSSAGSNPAGGANNTSGDDTVDSDLSKLFDNGSKTKVEEDSRIPASSPVDLSTDAVAADTGADFTIDKAISEKTDDVTAPAIPEPKPDSMVKKTEEITSATPAASGSLSATENKLKSKKDDLNKQISEIESKLKKVEDTLAKISDLRKQEDDILKAADEI